MRTRIRQVVGAAVTVVLSGGAVGVSSRLLPTAAVPQPTGWILTGLLLALVVATLVADRWIRTGAGAVLVPATVFVAAVVPGDRGQWVERVATGVLQAAVLLALCVVVTGLHALVRHVPVGRRRWAAVTALLGLGAWFVWLDWWALDAVPPAADDLLVGGFAATLVVAVLVGDLLVRPWFGGAVVAAGVTVTTFGPLTASDPLGAVAWIVVSLTTAGGAAAVCGVVAAARRLRVSPRT